ncbi:MAG TPA: sucrase ferredoxin [Actinomycetota bacterium]|nr:sucrase ferredoxin [Actinomycetota bacterium]
MIEPGGCAALAAAAGEPLAGTASRIRHWLMVEQPGPWGHEALLQGGLPIDVGRELIEREDRLGVRVLLIQRRDRLAPSPRRCFAAFTGRQERRLVTFEVNDVRELLDLDLEEMVRTRWDGLGEPVAGPLFLVCTHGKHDACCSRYGGPVARALAARPDVWECTHVGGDRFAGNVVCFPDGLYFGRVGAATAPRVAEAYGRGEVALEHYRGRSSFPPAVQAAERELRLALGLVGVDDLVLEDHARLAGSTHRVAFRVSGGRVHILEVRESTLDPRPLTCKAAHPHSPRAFVLERIA